MVDEISRGFEKLSSTRACFLDLSKAYDRISPVYAEIALRRLGLTGPFLSSIMDFIKGRRFVVQTHRGARTTKVRSQNGGLPQGSSLSCLIFLLTLDSVQSVIDSFKLSGVRCCAYADDLVVWITGSSPRKMAAVLGVGRSFLTALPLLRAFADQKVQFTSLAKTVGWDKEVSSPSSRSNFGT